MGIGILGGTPDLDPGIEEIEGRVGIQDRREGRFSGNLDVCGSPPGSGEGGERDQSSMGEVGERGEKSIQEKD